MMAAHNPSLPDFNPRGCQKGICVSNLTYAPQRLKYPLRRVGPRGSGKWKRISWEEALDEIADKMIDVAAKDGSECIVYDNGSAYGDYSATTAAEANFFNHIGATQLDGWGATGDMPAGVLTMGMTGQAPSEQQLVALTMRQNVRDLLARIAPSVQPGQVIIYHAWEPFQFKDWKGNQEPVVSAWKSLHMAEYGQLHYKLYYGGPHHGPRGTAVELQKA